MLRAVDLQHSPSCTIDQDRDVAGGVGYGEGRLTVSDNGQGIKNPNPTGSGLKLVSSLARQIGGTIKQESSDQGTTTSVIFPLIT